MASSTGSELIRESDVRNYFIQHRGIVKNNDIVTHFRSYLANPAIRDEARAVFKSIVNKLATVKVENGEKLLLLKRQFFPAFDGNGNNDPSGYSSQHHQQQQQVPISYGKPTTAKTTNPVLNTRSPPQHTVAYQQSQDYEYHQNYPLQQQSAPVTSGNPYNFNPYTHQVPPPYIPASNANYMSPPQQGHYQYYQHQGQGLQHQSPSQLSKSQPSLHGSNFSLSSQQHSTQAYNTATTNNAYLNYPQQHSSSAVLYNNNENYPPEYGLPTLPPTMNTSPPRRLSFTSSSASASGFLQGLQQQSAFDRHGVSPGRTPPPYRPPPSALGPGGSNTPPSLGLPIGMHGTRMMSPPSMAAGASGHQNYRSPPPVSLAYSPSRGYNAGSAGQMGQGQHHHQYQRSLSGPAPGNVTSPTGPKPNAVVSHSSSPASVAFLQAATTTASTPVTGIQPQFQGGLPGDGVPAPPVPPRFKRGSSSSNSPNSEANINRSIAATVAMSSDQEQMSSRGSVESGIDRETDSSGNDKENANPFNQARGRSSSLPNGSDIDGSIGSSSNPNGNGNAHSDDASEESEQKISVKERMQKFNRIASESELGKLKNSNNVNKGKQYVSELDDDTASLSSYGFGYANTEPRAREWIHKAATCDYHGINKMALENPALVRRKDVNGYTALHWAAKHGNLDLIKLLAGTFKSDTHSKTNGGYTPLHLAAQFSRHEAYELLIKVYNADPNIRDHAGKKPMQYLVRQDTTVSMDTFKKIKEKRRSTESQRDRDSSFLRIGSLNVRVKKTTEAFGNFLGKSNSSTSIERMMNRSWGSADNLQEAFDTSAESDKDREMMPPPNGNVVLRGSVASRDKNSQSRRSLQNSETSSSSIKNHMSSSDSEESDTACGFGSDWKN